MKKREQFLNYGGQYIDEEDIQAVIETLRSPFITQGPQIAAFEKDYLPTALFQFGTLVFPHGVNKTMKIIFYGNSVKNVDGKLVVAEKFGKRIY